MKNAPIILVAYPRGGHQMPLRLVEELEPFGEIRLSTYQQLEKALPEELPQLALCIVTDEESIQAAHELQGRLHDVPTLVVDDAAGCRIEANGFAGQVPAKLHKISSAVRELLPQATRDRRELKVSPATTPVRARLTSRLDQTLARSGGSGQSAEAILLSAAKHLEWELRADRAEAHLLPKEDGESREIFCSPLIHEEDPVSCGSKIVALIKGRTFPSTLGDLNARRYRPLADYLASRQLNLIIPLAREDRLFGWMAFFLEPEMMTEDFLDDLQIAAHLLTLSLNDAAQRNEIEAEENIWDEALLALKAGLLIIDDQGSVVETVGDLTVLGNIPVKGDPFKTIQSSKMREVIARMRKGELGKSVWTDPVSQRPFVACGEKLDDGSIVIHFGEQRLFSNSPAATARHEIDFGELVEALPLPVTSDTACGLSQASLPEGRVTREDSDAIKKCALSAKSRNAKVLRLRCGTGGSLRPAVLFFESPELETSSFPEDVTHAVQFSLNAA